MTVNRKEQSRMSFELHEKFSDVGSRYSSHVKMLKAAFFDSPQLIKKLGMDRQRKRSLPAFIVQATSLYTNSMKKHRFLDRLVDFELSAERLQEELDAVHALSL